jgi:Raf kinase inhibitor-like YbhB/YbcL family protein
MFFSRAVSRAPLPPSGPKIGRVSDVDRTSRRRGLAGRVARAAVALGCAVPLAACGLFSTGVTVTSPSVMTVTSGTFLHGTILPERYTCAGPHRLTPPLAWAGAPAGTKSIAIVLDDADAPITPYVYWVVFDIGPGTSALLEGKLPPGARQARGTAGYDKYDPPCPGSGGHGYRFTVYALNSVIKLPNGTSLESAWRAIAAATIGRGRLPVSATS